MLGAVLSIAAIGAGSVSFAREGVWMIVGALLWALGFAMILAFFSWATRLTQEVTLRRNTMNVWLSAYEDGIRRERPTLRERLGR